MQYIGPLSAEEEILRPGRLGGRRFKWSGYSRRHEFSHKGGGESLKRHRKLCFYISASILAKAPKANIKLISDANAMFGGGELVA